MAKLGAPNKGIVYFNDKEPVLVDVNGKGDFLASGYMQILMHPPAL